MTTDGHVYAYGFNFNRQLGLNLSDYQQKISILNPYLNNIISISGGNRHSLPLSIDGLVYSFGSKDECQLGLNSEVVNVAIPTLITKLRNIMWILSFIGVDIRWSVYGFGSNRFGHNNVSVPTLITGLNNIVQIIAVNHRSLVLSKDGNVYGFGNNNDVFIQL